MYRHLTAKYVGMKFCTLCRCVHLRMDADEEETHIIADFGLKELETTIAAMMEWAVHLKRFNDGGDVPGHDAGAPRCH